MRTSEEAASVRGTPLGEGAKALVLYGDGKPLMFVLPGDKKLDTKLVKQALSIKDLRMATPEEVIQVTHVQIGAVPPFGHIFEIPLYMDESLKKNTHVAFNAGLHTKSVRMKETDYEKVAKPAIGNYSR